VHWSSGKAADSVMGEDRPDSLARSKWSLVNVKSVESHLNGVGANSREGKERINQETIL